MRYRSGCSPIHRPSHQRRRRRGVGGSLDSARRRRTTSRISPLRSLAAATRYNDWRDVRSSRNSNMKFATKRTTAMVTNHEKAPESRPSNDAVTAGSTEISSEISRPRLQQSSDRSASRLASVGPWATSNRVACKISLMRTTSTLCCSASRLTTSPKHGAVTTPSSTIPTKRRGRTRLVGNRVAVRWRVLQRS